MRRYWRWSTIGENHEREENRLYIFTILSSSQFGASYGQDERKRDEGDEEIRSATGKWTGKGDLISDEAGKTE